jgi:hypothetical protein
MASVLIADCLNGGVHPTTLRQICDESFGFLNRRNQIESPDFWHMDWPHQRVGRSNQLSDLSTLKRVPRLTSFKLRDGLDNGADTLLPGGNAISNCQGLVGR